MYGTPGPHHPGPDDLSRRVSYRGGDRGYLATSIAHHQDGTTFAARARAAELYAANSRRQRHEQLQADNSVELAGDNEYVDANDEMTFGRRQKWKKLNLQDIPEPQKGAKDAGEAVGTADLAEQPGLTSMFTSHTRRHSASSAERIIAFANVRRNRIGQHSDNRLTVTTSQTPHVPIPGVPSPALTTTSYNQGNELQVPLRYSEPHKLRPVVNLPRIDSSDQNARPAPSQAVGNTRSYYPAVKGTSNNTKQRQARVGAEATVTRRDQFASTDGPNGSNWFGSTPVTYGAIGMPLANTNVTTKSSRQTTYKWMEQGEELDGFVAFVRPTLAESLSRPRQSDIDTFWRMDSRLDPATMEAMMSTANASRHVFGFQTSRSTGVGAVGDYRFTSRSEPSPFIRNLTFHGQPSSTAGQASNAFNKEPTQNEKEIAGIICNDLLLPVIANLKSYSIGPKDYFNPFSRAPDWTVDHSPAGQKSYFGEQDWGTPPARVGRDPRYRQLQHDSRVFEDYCNTSSSLRQNQYGSHKQWRSEESQDRRWTGGGEYGGGHRRLR